MPKKEGKPARRRPSLFRSLRRGLGGFLAAVGDILLWPIHFIRWHVARLRAWRQRRERPGGPSRLRILWVPFVLLVAPVVRLLQGLWRAMHVRCLLRGLPALILAITVGYLAVAAGFTSREELASEYELAARQAFYDREYETARLYYDRVLQLGGGGPQSVYQLALALNESDDRPRVAVLMDRLAPLDQAGYAPAHLWRAQSLLSAGNVSPRDLQIVEIHLAHALRQEPRNFQAKTLLGQICFAKGDLDSAIEHLADAARSNPESCLMLAKAYALKGNVSAAQQHGERAQADLLQQAEIHPTDLKARLALVQATVFLEQFPEALQILKQGIEFFEGDEAAIQTLRQSAATAYIACYDLHERQGNADPVEQFKLLAAGLNANPNDPALFPRVMDVLNRHDETADRAQKFLMSLLARGESSALVHLLLGTDASKRGDRDAATRHLEQAHQIDPNMLIAANNLAWHIAHTDPPELGRALALIDVVVQAWPEHGYVRDTRGQILAKMGRWEEAVTDLQAALPMLPENAQLHTTLADAYARLGMDGPAAEHRRIANELTQTQTSDQAGVGNGGALESQQ